MKKKNLKTLVLSKKSISKLDISGGRMQEYSGQTYADGCSKRTCARVCPDID